MTTPNTNPGSEREYTRHDRLTSELCDDIDVLNFELKQARKERDEWKTKYNRLLDDSLKDCQRTTGGLLQLALAGVIKFPTTEQP